MHAACDNIGTTIAIEIADRNGRQVRRRIVDLPRLELALAIVF
jgi:hypothetical protein